MDDPLEGGGSTRFDAPKRERYRFVIMMSQWADKSGVLRLEACNIVYTSPYYGSFRIALSEIAAIGEFTTQDGPAIDDRFLVFVLRSGEWFEASWYAGGMDECLQQLSAALGCAIHGNLCHSTDFASRMLWPAALAGCPLFTWSPAIEAGILRRLKLAVFPEVTRSLSSDLLSALERNA